MEKAKISIIVPAYNIAEYLGRCLESLLCQTYHNLEIIVIDDGSSDDTLSVLAEYAKKDSRIVAVHQKNLGVSAARNHGIDLATGDYIGFTDGDDYVEPDMFGFLANIIEEKNVDIAHCGYQMVFPNRVDYYYNTGTEVLFDRKTGLYELIKGTRIEPGLWNKLYRKELFQKVRLPVGIAIYEDLQCNFDLFMQARNSYYVDISKYHYILRKGSATNCVVSKKKRKDRFLVANYIYKHSMNDEFIRSAAYEKYIHVLIENAQQNDWSDLKLSATKRLKKEIKQILFDRALSKKTKGMVFGVVYFPWIYSLLRKIYEAGTGINHKYDF